MFLRRKEAKLADKLDRLLAGETIEMPAGLLEEKVWQVLRKLEQNEKKRQNEQESIQKLMSDVSHQLKTPLAALSLHLDLANDESLNEGEREASLRECKVQTEKVQWLTDALLKITRLETGLISVKRENENIIKTIREAAASVKPRALAKGLFWKERLPDVLETPHDPVWTKEALVNIMDNAIKYTNQGGINITLESGAIYTRIDIRDTGIGLAANEYTKIFTRFCRVRGGGSQRIEGTGLGLAITREILRKQGGNVTVDSKEGEGSTFSVFLQNC